MNREDIIRMAQEVGFSDGEIETCQLMLERFATLVIANHPPQSYMTWQEGYEAGKQTEREACAKLAITISEEGLPEEMPEGEDLILAISQIAGGVLIAEAIRERGQA